MSRLERELRFGLARIMRRAARWLDGYPVEVLGPIHGENGVRPNIDRLARESAWRSRH